MSFWGLFNLFGIIFFALFSARRPRDSCKWPAGLHWHNGTLALALFCTFFLMPFLAAEAPPPQDRQTTLIQQDALPFPHLVATKASSTLPRLTPNLTFGYGFRFVRFLGGRGGRCMKQVQCGKWAFQPGSRAHFGHFEGSLEFFCHSHSEALFML